MWWLPWVTVVGVVATVLLIAYLVDRRGGTGTGMTDRDRNDADTHRAGLPNGAGYRPSLQIPQGDFEKCLEQAYGYLSTGPAAITGDDDYLTHCLITPSDPTRRLAAALRGLNDAPVPFT